MSAGWKVRWQGRGHAYIGCLCSSAAVIDNALPFSCATDKAYICCSYLVNHCCIRGMVGDVHDNQNCGVLEGLSLATAAKQTAAQQTAAKQTAEREGM